MIEVTQLPKGGVFRFTTLLEELGKKHAKNTLKEQLTVIREAASLMNISIGNQQIGIVRRVVSGKTKSRGIMIRLFYQSHREENIANFLSNVQTKTDYNIEITFWESLSIFRGEKILPLFLHSIVFDGYADYYQNDTRKFMLYSFPKFAEKEGLKIKPTQFILLYASDRINRLVIERARGAEYMFFFLPDSAEQIDKLIELAELRKSKNWKSQVFWLGDVIGGI